MKVIYLDVKNEQKPQNIDIKDNLDTFYKLLDCRTIDIVNRQIGGYLRKKINISIICDDEGLLKSNPKTSAIDNLGKAQLVGNLIIAEFDDNGEMIDLPEEKTREVLTKFQKMYCKTYPYGYYMLTCCEY